MPGIIVPDAELASPGILGRQVVQPNHMLEITQEPAQGNGESYSGPPSRTAALFLSCFSFGFYRRIVGSAFGHTIGFLLLLASGAAMVVTMFFGFVIVPPLEQAARDLPQMVLSGGKLVVEPNAPEILYDDGAHELLLIRQAIDEESSPLERPYDVVVTLLSKGVEFETLGQKLFLAWPPRMMLDLESLDATALIESWWPFLCMVVFAIAFVWFAVTRIVFSIVSAIFVLVLGGPSRGTSVGQAFNVAAYAMAAPTWLMLGLLWACAFYRFPPALVQWSWALYAAAALLYLMGAIAALPRVPIKPWRKSNENPFQHNEPAQ